MDRSIYDIRAGLKPNDVSFVKAHTEQLVPFSFKPLQRKYGGNNDERSMGWSSVFVFLIAATIVGVPIAIGLKIHYGNKKNKMLMI